MTETEIHEYARSLFEAHGDRAVAEAARRAAECEQRNERDQAAAWRHVESALREIRGPRQG